MSNKTLNIQEYELPVTIRKEKKGGFTASCPKWSDCYAQGETIEDDTHWHLHVYPRVTKIAGFEIGCGFYANPSPPEDIAQILRETQIQ